MRDILLTEPNTGRASHCPEGGGVGSLWCVRTVNLSKPEVEIRSRVVLVSM